MRVETSTSVPFTKPIKSRVSEENNDPLFEAKSLNAQAYSVRNKNPEESIKLAKEALQIAVHHNFVDETWEAKLNIGFYHMYRGEHRMALESFTDVLFSSEEIDNQNLHAKTNYNLAVLHARIAEYEQAIKYLQKAYDLYGQVENEVGLAKCHFQFASIRFGLKKYSDAMNSAKKALELETKIQDQNAIAAVLTLIGRLHIKLSEVDLATAAFTESRELRKITNDSIGLASCLYYEMEVFVELKDFQTARVKIDEARDLFAQIVFPMGQTLYYQLDARCLEGEGRYEESIKKHEEAISHAQKFHLKSLMVDSYREIATIYEKLDDATKALQYYKWYLHSKEEFLTHRSRMQLDNIKLTKELNDAKKVAQLERFKQEELSSASVTISKMHQELKSSLTYAKRIQDAIMPSEEMQQTMASDHFFLNRPKEIVSGDFLFMRQEDDCKYLAVADCTGHGIPGCILSVYATNALNGAIARHGMHEPSQILNRVRSFFINDFMSEKVTLKDGMDIALVKITKSVLSFSGAYRSLYVRRGKELIELKGDRQPVGLFLNMNSFQSVEFDLQEGDQIYLFTDGITDQMGGDKMKKLKAPLFKKWLLELAHLPVKEQGEELSTRLKNWQGSLDQTDDMMIFSFIHHE